jgi:glyoxylate/hydroxypyruvate reductase A
VNAFAAAPLPAGVPLARSVDPTLTRHMVMYAKAAVLRHHRRFDAHERDTRERRWNFVAPLLPADCPVTVLGLGALGSSIARSLADEGFPVRGWSSSAKELAGVQAFSSVEGLAAAVQDAEIVLNVLPLTDSTRGILCASLFARMRRGGFLVNMGRGGHLVDVDLLQALEAGQLAGATLDVAPVEPLPADHLLWSHPGILVTPHVAGMTTPATAAIGVADNIRRAMEGRPLLNCVDRVRGY